MKNLGRFGGGKEYDKNILCTKHLNLKFDIKVGLVRLLSR